MITVCFQAICRTNRWNGEDKDFGYVLIIKTCFQNVESHRCVSRRVGSLHPVAQIRSDEEDRLKKGKKNSTMNLSIGTGLASRWIA